MSRSLKRMIVLSSIFLLAEVTVLGAILLMYFLDFPRGFHDIAKPHHWALGTIIYVSINIIFVIFSEIRLFQIRSKGDLASASIVGGDVQEAYNFGQLGLVVTDDEGIVLWTNSIFKERKINLLDTNILEWQPSLRELKDAPTEMFEKIEILGKTYQVRFLPEANLYIFKDITDLEQVTAYNMEQAICIGIIMIDNYSEVAGKTEDDNNDMIAKIRASIIEYCHDYGVLLRRYRNDSYFAVCNYNSLGRMEKDGFTLLQTIRLLGKGLNIIPTLSIGFAHRIDDVNKLSEMASNAVDIAMSRGGDQVVVSHYGEELRFFGGKTSAVENTGRVQFRSFADSLIGIIKGSGNVIVSGHMDMDMDALGSCLGVKAICDYCGVPCRIVYDPKLTEKKTRNALIKTFPKSDLDKIVISPKEAEERIRSTTLFVVVDVSVPNMVMGVKALEKSAKTIVIDHHRRGEAFIDKPVLQYVDPAASSATEIVTEFIHYASANPRIEVSPAYATIMLSGIFLDTGFFKSKSTGIRTFEAAEVLKEFSADNAKADDFLKDEYEEYALVTKIVSTIRTPYTGIVYCVADERDIVDRATLSKVANQLMQLKDIDAAFVIGRTQERMTNISARSNATVNVQLLCEKLGGGGHLAMAAAQFPDATIDAVADRLMDTLDMYLAEARTYNGGNQ